MTTQQMAGDTLSRRTFCALAGAGAFALGLGLAGCGQDVADEEASDASGSDEARAVEKAPAGDYVLRDRKSIYADDDEDSVVVMYLTVRRGNSGESTDHTWEEINAHSKYWYEEQGVAQYACEAILQIGDETGPLPEELGYTALAPNATVKVRGQSSSYYSQKNYKISLKKDKGSWRDQTVINLNKHQQEGMRFRNKFAFDLLKTIPQTTSCRTQFVHLYVCDQTQDGTNAAFEEWYLAEYGKEVKVNYTTYASNEDMYAKLKSGAVKYDIVIPSDYMIELMIEEDMLEEIDFSNIPNYQYIDENYRNLFYDPDNKYSVPYTYGMVGIIYNTTMVEGTPDSWGLMWDENYKGKILNFNNPRDAFGTAMYKLGIDVNTSDTADWDAAFEALKAQKPLVQSYVMDEIFNKMKGASAAIAPYYAGDFLTMYDDNNDLAFYYPKEGTNVFIDAICIPKGTQHKDIAEAYINFMLSEDAAIANAEYIGYASPNTLVRDSAEYAEYMNEIHPDAYDILYPENVEFLTSYFKNQSSETRSYMNNLWEDLKIESSFGGWIYIACAVIVVLLAAWAIFSSIRKKNRAKKYE